MLGLSSSFKRIKPWWIGKIIKTYVCIDVDLLEYDEMTAWTMNFRPNKIEARFEADNPMICGDTVDKSRI